MVYPWLPPPGVPAEVLKTIRMELLKRLWERIQKSMEPRSAQPSLALSERSLVTLVERSVDQLRSRWPQKE